MANIVVATLAAPPELFRILGPADDSTKDEIADCRLSVVTICQVIDVDFDAVSAAAKTVAIDGVLFERKMSEGKTVYFEVGERLIELRLITTRTELNYFQSKVGGLPAYLRVSDSSSGDRSN